MLLHQEGRKIIDLWRFGFSPVRFWYRLGQRRQFLAVFLEALVTRMRSSTNIKWLKSLERLLLKPGTRLRDKTLLRIAERIWTVRRNSKGENRSPYLTPMLLEIQEEWCPLRMKEKEAEENEAWIQVIQRSRKCILRRVARIAIHSTVPNAFSTSIFKIILGRAKESNSKLWAIF